LSEHNKVPVKQRFEQAGQQGGWPPYESSGWAYREGSLSEKLKLSR